MTETANGLCQCGCGKRTTVATRSDSAQGSVRGQPRRYAIGHSRYTGGGSGHFSVRPEPTPFETLERAAARSVEDEHGCWIFTGALSQGYGTIGHKGGTWRVHRLAYEVMVGPVPNGLFMDHLCRNRACWNPSHLDVVTPRINLLRGQAPTVLAHHRGECIRGHDMTDPRNVYASGGRRQCAVCVRRRSRELRQAKRVSA